MSPARAIPAPARPCHFAGTSAALTAPARRPDPTPVQPAKRLHIIPGPGTQAAQFNQGAL